MTTIIFIRHGESQTNKFIHDDPNDPHLHHKLNAICDPHLTEMGVKQAEQVGKHLVKNLDGKNVRVLKSFFTRTHETSQPFCDEYREHITTDESLEILLEYTRPEKIITPSDLKKGLKNHTNWDDFTKTVVEFADLLEDMAQSNDQPIIIFGHSLYLSVLLSYLGSNKTYLPTKQELMFRFPNCSISSFEYSQGSWRIFNVASIMHLSPDITTGTECPF